MDRENNVRQGRERIPAKEKKKEKGKKKGPVIFVALLLIIAIAAAVFYAVPTIMSSRRDNISGNQEIIPGEGEDKAFLFTIDSGEAENITKLSGGGFITTSNSLISIRKDGSVVDITRTGYSQPAIKSCGKYYIAFERSTGKFCIMDKNGTVFSSQTDGEIINADIASNGSYMIMSRKTLSTSLVTVYSAKNEIVFQWECNESYLTNCSIAPGGRKFAVTTFDVEKGEQVSSVLIFTTKSTGVEKKIDCGSDIVCDTTFLGSDTVGIVTDKNYLIADIRSGEINKIDYEYDIISGSVFGENGNLAVLKSEFGSLDTSTISLYDKNAGELFSHAIGEKVIDFCFDKSFVYVMTPGRITVYSIATGEKYSKIETSGGLKKMEVISGRIFCCSDTGIYKYDR